MEGCVVGSLSALALVLLIIALLVPILTAGHILRRIAHLSNIVVDLSQLAAKIARILTVQADIELLAICGMRVPGMGDHLATHIALGLVLGAGEAALGFLCANEKKRNNNIHSQTRSVHQGIHNSLSGSPQPSRFAVSGQTQVPEYSSKCSPTVHFISSASPSMQL